MWPSKEWFEEIVRTANASKELKDLGKGWEGDFLSTIVIDEEAVEDMKKESFIRNFLSMLSLIPKEDRALFRGTHFGDAFERILEIPLDAELEGINVEEALGKISEKNIDDFKGATINIWMDYDRGRMRNYIPVALGEHENAYFKISGPYSAWKKVGEGEVSVPELITKGDLKFTGDITPIMENLAGFNALLGIFGSVALKFRCQHCGYIGNKVEFKLKDTKLYGQLLQCPKCWSRSPG